MKQLTKQEVEAVLAKIAFLRFEETPTQSGNFGPGLIPGKRPIYKMGPIKIGDVLEKIETMEIIPDDGHTYIQRDRFTGQLLELWKDCTTEEDRAKGRTALSRSLQEIVETSGWNEHVECNICGDPCSTICSNGATIRYEILQSPEANALFSFLQKIGL